MFDLIPGESEARERRAERKMLRKLVAREVEALDDHVGIARDPTTARRILAGHWRWLEAEQRRVDEACGGDIDVVGLVAMKLNAHWEVVADPVFDQLPMRAAGMSCVDELDGAPVWVGTAAAMLRAATGARRRGMRLDVDAANRVTRHWRQERLVATLVEDPGHAASEHERPITPWRPRRRSMHVPIALVFAAFGVLAVLGVMSVWNAIGFGVMSAAFLWLWLGVMPTRRRSRPAPVREPADERAIEQLRLALRRGVDAAIATIDVS